MANLAANLRRHFIWLLLTAYAVATLFPGPGSAAARFDLAAWAGVGGRATAPLVMVAALLFLAAMAVDFGQLRVLLQRPVLWAAGLFAVWLGPAVVVAAAGFLLPALPGGAGPGLLLGMTLVAAMPVANSSVAWTQQSGGSLPWSLGLVVLSILLTPWVTPPLLLLSGVSLSGGESDQVEQLIRSLSSVPFIVWVLLPTVAGLALRRWLGPAAIEALGPARQVLSAGILLLLNYASGSLALPQFFEHPSGPVLMSAATAALLLAGVGLLLAGALSLLFRLDRPTHDAMRFGLSMKHTGLAFALAATAGLADHPETMLVIVVATPVQHLVAAIVDRSATGE